MRKKLLVLVALLLMASMVFTACGGGAGTTPEEPAAETPAAETPAEETPAEETPAETPADSGDKPYIAIISKGFQHQFWQTVYKGAQDAAAKYNVDITFDGPPSESDVSTQIDMLNAALAKNPKALCLAALDTED